VARWKGTRRWCWSNRPPWPTRRTWPSPTVCAPFRAASTNSPCATRRPTACSTQASSKPRPTRSSNPPTPC